MQIEKMLVLSTSHITDSTDQILKNESLPFTVETRETGYLVNTVMLHTESMKEGEGGIDISDYPSDLKDCIKLAQENDCEWLLLDRDGPVECDLLPVFEW